MSARSSAKNFKKWPGMLSGPIALLGFKFERSFFMPRESIVMGFIVGNLSSSLKVA